MTQDDERNLIVAVQLELPHRFLESCGAGGLFHCFGSTALLWLSLTIFTSWFPHLCKFCPRTSSGQFFSEVLDDFLDDNANKFVSNNMPSANFRGRADDVASF